jgi:hypothetical protein
MDVETPAPMVTRRKAPMKAPCPRCGVAGRRKRTLTRLVREVAYERAVARRVVYGEYAASCGCSKTFRTTPPGVRPRARYGDQVRRLVFDRVVKDGMSVDRALASIRRDFHLTLSAGFAHRVLRERAATLDLAARRRESLERFGGVLCVDELHLGRATLLLATDPTADAPVAFAVVGKNDAAHMRRFLGNLKSWGFLPRVVVSDGARMYPGVVAEVWPRAAHQLCLFHAVRDLIGPALDAARRLRRAIERRGRTGRKRRRGRPSRRAKEAAERRGPTLAEKAGSAFRRRHLVVKRREKLTDAERADLAAMIAAVPGLAVPRRFADAVYAIFDGAASAAEAASRRDAVAADPEFLAVPELARAIRRLKAPEFDKVAGHLDRPEGLRERTNNHVERTNRSLRLLEKVRYGWRRRRTLVRFLALKLDEIWSRLQPTPDHAPRWS